MPWAATQSQSSYSGRQIEHGGGDIKRIDATSRSSKKRLQCLTHFRVIAWEPRGGGTDNDAWDECGFEDGRPNTHNRNACYRRDGVVAMILVAVVACQPGALGR
jgi:hypothetical protein